VGAPFSIVSGGSFTLAAGASQNVVVRFRPTAAGSFAGNVNFTAQGDTIARGVTGATTGSAPNPPSGSAQSDLAIYSLVTPTTVTRNVPFPVSFYVRNYGATASGTVQLRIYLSRNDRPSSDDVLLYSRSYSSIAAGANLSTAISEVIPSGTSTGSYYLIVHMDATGQFTEPNEWNNMRMNAVTVR
jgi:CARDB